MKEKATVAAVDGTLMPAREIFAQALRYLKNHMIIHKIVTIFFFFQCVKEKATVSANDRMNVQT